MKVAWETLGMDSPSKRGNVPGNKNKKGT